jgi:hypothetical protein
MFSITEKHCLTPCKVRGSPSLLAEARPGQKHLFQATKYKTFRYKHHAHLKMHHAPDIINGAYTSTILWRHQHKRGLRRGIRHFYKEASGTSKEASGTSKKAYQAPLKKHQEPLKEH